MADLRVGVVSGLLDTRYGGPSTAIKVHVDALRRSLPVVVFGVAPRGREQEVREYFESPFIFTVTWPGRWFRGRGLGNALRANALGVDVFHAHMLWDYPVYATWQAAKRLKLPFVVTPHGSLIDPWRRRGLKKRMYRWLILNGMFRDVGALHVLTDFEERACREIGIRARIEVIPNGLPEATYDRRSTSTLAWETWPDLKGRRVMIYLGRLWGEKGLDILPQAWRDSRADDGWLLVIAGPDYRRYEAHLRSRIDALGLEKDVLIVGPVSGPLKWSLLASAECLVLPSHSEAFSMVLLEAMAAGRPSIYSIDCHLPVLARVGGGWEVPADREALGAALVNARRLDTTTMREVGEKAALLGRSEFTAELVAERLVALYRSLLSER